MIYSLELDLVGADKIGATLGSLQTAVKNLSSGNVQSGSIFSTGSGSPTAMMVSDLAKGKVYSKDIATNLAQGFASWRGSAMDIFKKMNPKVRESIFSNHPDLAAEWNAMMNPKGIIKGLRETGGRDLAKIFGMGQFNASGSVMKGLRDIGGADLAKVGAMGVFGAGVIKGLRDVTGKDLAKVQAMGSFEENTKSPTFLSRISALPAIAKYLTIIGAVTLALDVVKKAAEALGNAMRNAIQQGFGIYSGAGQAGLSGRFFESRQALASIFGISGNPNQVFMFGKAVTDMSRRISDSVNTLAATAPSLATIHMNLDVLKLDFAAAASEITNQFSPAIDLFLGALDGIVKNIVGYANLIKALPTMSAAEGLAAFAALSVSTYGKMIKSSLDFVKTTSPLTPLMKQLPASQLEHMGLNLGFNSGDTTNNLIRKSNQYLAYLPHIANALQGGLSRGQQFGMSATVNNP